MNNKENCCFSEAFKNLLNQAGIKINENLKTEIIQLFAVNKKMVDLADLKQSYLRIFPNTKLPPPPPDAGSIDIHPDLENEENETPEEANLEITFEENQSHKDEVEEGLIEGIETAEKMDQISIEKIESKSEEIFEQEINSKSAEIIGKISLKSSENNMDEIFDKIQVAEQLATEEIEEIKA